ncbi:glutamate-cysteine ligase family protein [Microbulbifer guangxiensis]|uniref:glutamate-cysteine ligase family protein n=1 Tax=Microbulbifer guangxiensis TaxID=2904249 RepID=UPI001F014438|nr:glutamate-cysteine ligase family protein [Microbulbifer guangxiensis]
MGQEIATTEFTDADEQEFRRRLRAETNILNRWFQQERFEVPETPMCGIELEGWLTDGDFVPAPESETFLTEVGDELVVPEISRFNFELNSIPAPIEKRVFSDLNRSLSGLWRRCADHAESMGLRAIAIGSLPTIRANMLTLEHIYPSKRYFALNNRVMELRRNQPTVFSLEGKEVLRASHPDIMLEAAATSVQVHLQVALAEGKRFFNASTIASPFMAAVAANSPFLYGKALWSETRIPIFEQAVNLGSFRNLDGSVAKRVSLGNGYVRESLLELFLENLDGYPVLLPDNHDRTPEELCHLRLHNGTIWRWNRPLIGIGSDGIPHLRIEHRVPSSGPSMPDVVANTAFFLGLATYLARMPEAPEDRLGFDAVKRNFFQACKYGLNAEIEWIDGKLWNLQRLVLDELIGPAEEALESLGVDRDDIYQYVTRIIRPRVLTGQNGSNWQRAYINTHGPDFQRLLEEYYEYQKRDIPVHEWKCEA